MNHTPHDPSESGQAFSRANDHANPYRAASGGTHPGGAARHDEENLDANAPILMSPQDRRLNFKMLSFVVSAIVLLLLVVFALYRRATADDDTLPPSKPDVVDVPELPKVEPALGARAAAEANALPLADMPPLPTEPAPRNEPAAALAGSSGPTLIERRIADGGGMAGKATGPGDPDPQIGNAFNQQMQLQQQLKQQYAVGTDGAAIRQDPATAPDFASQTTSAQPIRNPDGLLVRGTYIRCVLEARIVTDVPGFTSCIVTEPVYSINGRRLLLPKGSKVVGAYDTDPSGPRVAVVWDRITTPNGFDIDMKSPGVDNLGSAGHPGQYDAHWPSRMASALMISLVADAFKYAAAENGPAQAGIGYGGAVVQSPYESATAHTMESMANQVLKKNMTRPATVTINQGTVINVYVAKDVDFSTVLSDAGNGSYGSPAWPGTRR